MNENINLCEILKGHEGEIFYCPIYRNVFLLNNEYGFITISPNEDGDETTEVLGKDGTIYEGGEMMLFPSKDQRDWNKWVKEQKPKIPKTWDELCNNDKCTIYHLSEIDKMGWVQGIDNTLIEKSALALLKINQLIEVGYGGNVTNPEWKNLDNVYCIEYDTDINDFVFTDYCFRNKKHIAFHTEEQVKEFLKYPENVQLLKDYFMI